MFCPKGSRLLHDRAHHRVERIDPTERNVDDLQYPFFVPCLGALAAVGIEIAESSVDGESVLGVAAVPRYADAGDTVHVLGAAHVHESEQLEDAPEPREVGHA